jgi:serine/threonine protein phosphatase 1
MFKFLKTMFAEPAAHRGKAGARAYAIGDIHGRLDLLDALLCKIEAEIAERPADRIFLIFLGDLIDRGPDSAEVVERLRTYLAPAGVKLVFLMGNHEEVMLKVLAGEKDVLDAWLTFGGAECLESYGISRRELEGLSEEAALALIAQRVPAAHRTFLESFADTFRFGDYLFVHAGIRPGLGIEEQAGKDLRWIREPFLSDSKEHGCMVVHGHTIVEKVDERRNRIGIDTGAYRTGILTALAVEEAQRWYVTADAADLSGAAARAGQPERIHALASGR